MAEEIPPEVLKRLAVHLASALDPPVPFGLGPLARLPGKGEGFVVVSGVVE